MNTQNALNTLYKLSLDDFKDKIFKSEVYKKEHRTATRTTEKFLLNTNQVIVPKFDFFAPRSRSFATQIISAMSKISYFLQTRNPLHLLYVNQLFLDANRWLREVQSDYVNEFDKSYTETQKFKFYESFDESMTELHDNDFQSFREFIFEIVYICSEYLLGKELDKHILEDRLFWIQVYISRLTTESPYTKDELNQFFK